MNPAQRIVVMGVCGSGKSTVGRGLAAALAVPYVEGDELHPADNVQRMASGIALTDADRRHWLQQVAQALADARARSAGVVVACSALKRSYRDQLRVAAPDVRFIHLAGGRELIEQRLAARQGHYMPASLLQSQLDTLEPPGDDEGALTLTIDRNPEALVAEALQRLTGRSPS